MTEKQLWPMTQTEKRLVSFAKHHILNSGSDTEARITSEVLQQRCLHCGALIEIPIRDGELVAVGLEPNGTVAWRFVAPA